MTDNTGKETKTSELIKLLKSVPTVDNISAEASDLHRAAVVGDMGFLKQSLDSEQCDINLTDDLGYTPLYVATLKGYAEIVELLVSKGAKINDSGDDSIIDSNPLLCAQEVSIAKILLKAGGDVNARNSEGNTPLQSAVMREDESIVLLLLEHEADVNLRNSDGCSALHTSCESSGSETMVNIMRNLIANGADVNAANHFGMTPLHCCAKRQCSKSAVKVLVSNGGNLNMHDYQGNCPVHYFCLYLADDEDNFIETLEEFLTAPETANVINMKGQTALHLATDTSANVIEKLLERGCDINKGDNHGKTALHVASCLKRSEEIIQTLLDNGANVNARDEWERTPLHEAAYAGNDAVAKVLISHKADVNAKDICGCSPLHESTSKYDCEIVETLIKSGANVNNTDANGSTPLHFAAWENSEISVDLLLKNGAKSDVKDALGETPLDVAIYRKAGSVLPALTTGISENNTQKTQGHDHYRFSCCGGQLLTEKDVKRMIENNEIVRGEGETDLKTYMMNILESPGIGRGCDDEEAIEIQQAMEHLVQNLADKMGKIDGRVHCKLIHAGSTSEGTKTRQPDEFDYIFALEEFSKHCTPVFQEVERKIQKGVYLPIYFPGKPRGSDNRPDSVEKQLLVSVSDYANVEISKSKVTDPFINFAGGTTMPVYRMYDGFFQLLTKVAFSPEFPKNPRLIIKETTMDPAMTLRWRGCRYKDLDISADLVPAIVLQNWPDQFDKKRTILTPDILRLPSLIVPKMTTGTDVDLWRCSQALEETAIFRKLRPDVRNSYITCKALVSSTFCPLINFGENEEDMASYKFENDSLSSDEDFKIYDEPESVVPSYMLKMMFLAAIESKAKDAGLESVYNEPIISETIEGDNTQLAYGPAKTMNVTKPSYEVDVPLVLEVFRRCEECIERKFVPSFFNLKHNVLGSRVMEDEAGKAALYIKVIRSLLEK